MKKLLLVLLMFICGNVYAQIDELFKFSTVYSSLSVNNSLFAPSVWQLEDGKLVDRSKDNPSDFALNLGIRKLARFEYQKKKGEFYTGEEREHSDKSIVGAVKGLEFKAQVEIKRQQGREFENRHLMARYLGDFYVIKAEQFFNGLADIQIKSLDTRLRLKIGNKLNFTAGVMNGWRPLGYEYNALQAYEDSGNPWFQLAYDRGFEDQYYYVDGDQNGVDDWYDWYDWYWLSPGGDRIAETDYEFYKYHFPQVVRDYQIEMQDSLGLVRELNLALGTSFYHYGERFWLHCFADVFPKRWMEEIDEDVARYIELDEERIDYSIGFVLGTKIGVKKKLGFFIEGDYNDLFDREFFYLTGGINYLFY